MDTIIRRNLFRGERRRRRRKNASRLSSCHADANSIKLSEIARVCRIEMGPNRFHILSFPSAPFFFFFSRKIANQLCHFTTFAPFPFSTLWLHHFSLAFYFHLFYFFMFFMMLFSRLIGVKKAPLWWRPSAGVSLPSTHLQIPSHFWAFFSVSTLCVAKTRAEPNRKSNERAPCARMCSWPIHKVNANERQVSCIKNRTQDLDEFPIFPLAILSSFSHIERLLSFVHITVCVHFWMCYLIPLNNGFCCLKRVT